MRDSPKRGCGSPKAADSPKTKIRMVPGDFSCGMEMGCGRRAMRGPKKRHPNLLFCTNVFWLLFDDGNRNDVAWPNPASLNPTSRRTRKVTGATIIRARHISQSFAPET